MADPFFPDVKINGSPEEPPVLNLEAGRLYRF